MSDICAHPMRDRIVEFVDSMAGDDRDARVVVIAGLLFETARRAPDLVADVIADSRRSIAELQEIDDSLDAIDNGAGDD